MPEKLSHIRGSTFGTCSLLSTLAVMKDGRGEKKGKGERLKKKTNLSGAENTENTENTDSRRTRRENECNEEMEI